MSKRKTNDNGAGFGGKKDGPSGLGAVVSIEDVKAETLVGDLRDLILQEMRDAKEGLPWTLRGETAQREAIDRIDRFSRSIIERTINLVAARGQRAVPAAIRQWRIKEGIQIQVDAVDSVEHIMAIAEGGRLVRIVFADPASFEGERVPLKPNPDQRRFGFDGDDDDDDGPVFDNGAGGGSPASPPA